MDFAKLKPLTITYDDPFNLKDARAYRASLGFLFSEFDKNLFEKFKKLGYQWTSLPESDALCGVFPYRNKVSLAFGATRFLPACLTYLFRNQKAKKEILKNLE